MNKAIKSGTSINDTVAAVEKALEHGNVVLTAAGNAISKAITISEIVHRNTPTGSLKQANRLYKGPYIQKEKEVPSLRAADEEEGEFEEVLPPKEQDRFQPCLEITLTRA